MPPAVDGRAMRRFAAITITHDDDGEYHVTGHLQEAGPQGRSNGPLRVVANVVILHGRELRLREGSRITLEGGSIGLKANEVTGRVEVQI